MNQTLSRPAAILVAVGLVLTVVGLFTYYGAAWKVVSR